MMLDVTATTLTFTTRLSQVQVPYARSSEAISLTGSPAIHQHARELTPNNFTFNLVSDLNATTTRCIARDFHR
jgi:hypothetical protein